ncbi:hypothetical protein [Sutcliffiella halmapala]|uniref:hypothetical protein n=1 Tax=Sutcliffiella halmapala TaxID=79882 RepID=UPI001475CEA0|nr:hypothetical protein [Sutcliffiella halmapala]
MSGEKKHESNLNTEDLVVILETAKEIGTTNKDIDTVDFINRMKKQLIRAMTKSG